MSRRARGVLDPRAHLAATPPTTTRRRAQLARDVRRQLHDASRPASVAGRARRPGRASILTRRAPSQLAIRRTRRPHRAAVTGRHAVRTRHRSRDPRPAAHGDEDLLRLQHALRRAAEHARLSGLPRASRARCRCSTAAPSSSRSRRRWRSAARCSRCRCSRARTTSIPDLPKGYQISQYELPLALERQRDAGITTARRCSVGILRVHMEEDAGKSLHEGFPDSDRAHLRRLQPRRRAAHRDRDAAGSPVGARPPRISSAACARCSSPLGVNDGNLEEGSLRCDANVSVRPVGQTELGVKAEIKNLNSFRFVQKAHRARDRAADRGRLGRRAGRAGDPPVGRGRRPHGGHAQQGRSARLPLFPRAGSAAAASSRSRRSSTLGAELPELPDARRRRLVEQYALPPYDAGVLTAVGGARRLFRSHGARGGQRQGGQQLDHGRADAADERGVGSRSIACRSRPPRLAGLIKLVEAGTINGPTAKQVFERMFASGESAEAIVQREGLGQIDDEGAVVEMVRGILRSTPTRSSSIARASTPRWASSSAR